MSEYLELLRDPAHWAFELTLVLLIDVVLGVLVWPRIRRHIHRDVIHAELHGDAQETDPADDVHPPSYDAQWATEDEVEYMPLVTEPVYTEYERARDLEEYRREVEGP